MKKGYIPLALNRYAAIAWQGEYLGDFWMWNGQYNAGAGSTPQTVKVTALKEAALRYWRDKWVPLKWDEDLLKRMEDALRAHKGLKAEGVAFPAGRFLPEPGAVPIAKDEDESAYEREKGCREAH